MSWYKTSTISLINGSTVVTGAGSCTLGGYLSKATCELAGGTWSGTAFIANAAAGEALLAPDGKFYEIAAVVSDTSLTLGSNYLGTTASGQAYTILPSQSFVRDLAAQAAALIQTYADIATGAGAGKFSAGTSALPGIAGSADTDTGINLAGSNVLNLVAGGATRVAVTTAGAAVTGTLSTSGNATLGDSTSADSHTVNGIVAISANSPTNALKITQAGAGNAFVVEDVASDASPFVIDANGNVGIGISAPARALDIVNQTSNCEISLDSNGETSLVLAENASNSGGASLSFRKARGGYATKGIVQNGDSLGTISFVGHDGVNSYQSVAGVIQVLCGGVPGANDMPGIMTFSTTDDGSASPTERMRIDSAGSVAIGSSSTANQKLAVVGFRGASTTGYCTTMWGNYDLAYTSGVGISISTPMPTNGGTPYTVSSYQYFSAVQGTFNADATVTNQIGFGVASSLIGATNNYAFQSNIPSGTGRWNFYAAGTAPNYFAGDVRSNTVVTKRTTTTTSDTTATASAASLITGIRLGTPTAAIELQVPTGTNMDAAFQDLQQYQSFEWSYINMASATHTCTITSNTDHTLNGNMIVQPNSSGRFLTRKSGTNTFSTYRIA